MKQAMATRTLDPRQSESTAEPPPSPEEIAGKFPQFEIVECLGRGGMGVVYKARQKSLDRWVAIKILAPDRRGEERFAERFASEAQVLARMNHPNIVTVYDHGETSELFYIVMEYVDGVNLRDVLRDGKMDPEQALAIVPPICEALDYAHGKGVIHRDIKPKNLLLDREGRVKIADFGIAELVGGAADISGTPPYMAPEQAAGKADRRADIYALGVVLYEMLTGERPAKGEVVAPSKKVEIDVKLDEVVLRALDKEPERRYQTASELRTVLATLSTPGTKSSERQPNARMPPRSGWGWLIGKAFGITFTSRGAFHLANLSALGFLGCLGFLEQVGLSGASGLFGLFGLFGNIGLAFVVEGLHRNSSRKQDARTGGASTTARWALGFLLAAILGTPLLLAIVPGGRHDWVLVFAGLCAMASLICALASLRTKLGRRVAIAWGSVVAIGAVLVGIWMIPLRRAAFEEAQARLAQAEEMVDTELNVWEDGR
ncbi:MAG: serine/threonine protein kinase [Verrucomicrobiae bacterium]|nr:serine/threonine protein kinase [Verrucomicrobiae bacterium]